MARSDQTDKSLGAGYMSRDDPVLDQPAVNAFVTDLIANSASEANLSAFLRQNIDKVFYDAARQVWVVNP